MAGKRSSRLGGRIVITAKGTGYVEVEGFEQDVLVEPKFLNTALHGDTVEIVLFPKRANEQRQGEVARVVERAKTRFVGTVQRNGERRFCFVVPDDKHMYTDIFVPSVGTRKVRDGDKVVAELVSFKDPAKSPEGRILRVLGKAGDNDVEMESIVYEKGLALDFPPEVEKAAQGIATAGPASELQKRRDMRNAPTFTIDPRDAKDFDDAISYRTLGNGDAELGVHIADVSHYVKEGGVIDKEAQARGFSVYLVDRTVPMLPEVLSNGVCSLNPREDKLTFSVVLRLNKKAEVRDAWLGRTVIRSDKRFTYQGAQKVLDAGRGPFAHELKGANALAEILRKERFEKGALDFEQDEVGFVFDQEGHPLEVFVKERLDTHKLIEEFMILANVRVAEFLGKERGAPTALFRVHDKPDASALGDLLSFLRALGYGVKMRGGTVTPRELNALFDKLKGDPREALVKTVALRAMAKAEYSTVNIGHFGLALDYYTHFTSPIRRYADLLVHRMVRDRLERKQPGQEKRAEYRQLAKDISSRELAVVEAERDSVAYKQTQFMLERIGETFSGIITGITQWGVYIEERNTRASGMVRLRDMADDFYEFDKESYALMGTKTKKRYALGDAVRFKVVAGDLDQKNLDYAFT